jgi:hypothetical protein
MSATTPSMITPATFATFAAYATTPAEARVAQVAATVHDQDVTGPQLAERIADDRAVDPR